MNQLFLLILIVFALVLFVSLYYRKIEEVEVIQHDPPPFCRFPRQARDPSIRCVRPILRKDGRLSRGNPKLAEAQARWMFVDAQERAMLEWEREWDSLFPPVLPEFVNIREAAEYVTDKILIDVGDPPTTAQGRRFRSIYEKTP